MKSRKSRTFLFFGAVSLSLCILFSSAGAQDIKFMNGPMGGTWYPLCGAIAEKVKALSSRNISVVPGTGTLNVEIIDAGKAHLGFTNLVSTFDGMAGTAPFKQKTKNVRHIATLYYTYFQMVTNEAFGINSLADMKGKGLLPGTRGSTMEPLVAELLRLYGLTYKDMSRVDFVSYNDGINMMRNNQLHLLTTISMVPTSVIVELASSFKIKMLSIPKDKSEKITKWNPGYSHGVIPANSYPNQKEPIDTVGNYLELICAADLSDEFVYIVTKVLAENLKDLVLSNAELRKTTPKDLALDVGVPIHPGALKYYKEKGLR